MVLNTSVLVGTRLERKSAEKEINNLIDTRDWQDDELIDVDKFEPFKE